MWHICMSELRVVTLDVCQNVSSGINELWGTSCDIRVKKIVSCGIFVWQHHCRNCGEIFCNECSSTKMPLPSSAKPVRVCDDCSTKLLQRYSANWWNRQSPTNLTCFLRDTSDSSILSQKNCLVTEPSWCVQFTINLKLSWLCSVIDILLLLSYSSQGSSCWSWLGLAWQRDQGGTSGSVSSREGLNEMEYLTINSD